MTPGLRTSEFWLSLAVIVAVTVLTALGSVDAGVGVPTIAGAAGAYGVSRGLRKSALGEKSRTETRRAP